MEILFSFLFIVFQQLLYIQTDSLCILRLIVSVLSKSFPGLVGFIYPSILILWVHSCQTIVCSCLFLTVVISRHCIVTITHKVIQNLNSLCQDLSCFLKLAQCIMQKTILTIYRIVREQRRNHRVLQNIERFLQVFNSDFIAFLSLVIFSNFFLYRCQQQQHIV